MKFENIIFPTNLWEKQPTVKSSSQMHSNTYIKLKAVVLIEYIGKALTLI